jgi:TonB-dependent SusC/RagA subfamily outer membrane receptor
MSYKRISTGLFLIAGFIAISGFIWFDDDPLNRIATQLNKWISDNPQEKVYLQTDKPYYAIGDDIWFKAYLTTGSEHHLSAISKVLNVELINNRDSVKQSLKLPVTNGLTWGDFTLPDTLKEGNYRIRAYTNWMRNAGSDYFFDKAITITNSISNNIFTNVVYSYNSQNGRQKVNAKITYTNLSGTPYSGKTVSYQVQFDAKSITRGKGITDGNGNISIDFVDAVPGKLKSGRIITQLKVDDKKTIEKSVLIKATSTNVDVQFFPEGGNFVYGNETKLAFKTVGADGLGADVKGIIVDDQNKQTASFGSTHLGMGVFNMKPANGRSYKAKLVYADGSENTVDIPKPTNGGYTMSVNDGAGNVSIKISPGAIVETSNSQTEVISLVGQEGGVIYYAAKSSPGSKFFTASIPKNKFPTGIVQFTLFSSSGEPLNERLVFVQNHEELKLNAIPDKQQYAPREKVKFNLEAKDKDGNPANGSFSIAVTDETKVPVDEAAAHTILSNTLLTSELNGYVEKPGYYFLNEDKKTTDDLDVLMMTQGYHRFEWKKIIDNSYPAPKYAAEKSLEISGHIKTLSGKPVAHGKVTLFSIKKGVFILDTISDNEGKFTFQNLIFGDSVKFVIQARTSKDRKNLQIDLDNVTAQEVGANKNYGDLQVNISNGLSSFLQNSKSMYEGQLKYGVRNRSIVLKEVVITAKKEPVITSSNLNGAGNADQVLKSNVIGTLGCARLADCLQGMLFGVTFRNGVAYSTRSLNTPMLIVVDDVYADSGLFNDLNPADIESIEVLRSGSYTSIYGGRGSGGVLIVTTKRGTSDVSYQRYAPGIITYMPKGYSKVREFYSPRYDDPKTNAQVPDLRSTIYWKPNIITDKEGKASFDFFNADSKGTYRVVIEGVDANGNLGRKVLHYKVE